MGIPIANTRTGLELGRVSKAGKLSEVEHRWIGNCQRCSASHRLEGKLMTAWSPKRGGEHVIQTAAGAVYLTANHGHDTSEVVIMCGNHWCRLFQVQAGAGASTHHCGVHCTKAAGPICECACRGQNHGKGHCSDVETEDDDGP